MHDCTWLQQAHGLSESGLNRTFYATFADETPSSTRIASAAARAACSPAGRAAGAGRRRLGRRGLHTTRVARGDRHRGRAVPRRDPARARRQKSCRACVADDEPADDDGSAAARVLRRFAFVGVQSAWNDTVHAFAERFGVPPLASDLVVSRPG